jgi:hypothetical protein
MTLNWSLKYDPMVLILNHLQVPIKLPHQPGIYRTCISVQVSLVIHLNNLSNEIYWRPHNISSNYIPLWECLPVCHFSHSGGLSFLGPFSHSALGVASRHSFTK